MNDFSSLRRMKYSGRGITIGMTPEGNPFMGYTITGRSPSSQARKLVFDEDTSTVKTEVTDPEQLKKGNPALLIYPAIISIGNGRIVASNGAQTRLLAESAIAMREGIPLEVILNAMMYKKTTKDGINITTYEPDSPNFTPRINGCLDKKYGGFYIVKKSEDSNREELDKFPFKLEEGSARAVTTYLGGNETPLLPFKGMMLEFEVSSNDAKGIAEDLYTEIKGPEGENYRVSTAVMISKPSQLEVAIINRSERGE